jgi:hypothetical protein
MSDSTEGRTVAPGREPSLHRRDLLRVGAIACSASILSAGSAGAREENGKSSPRQVRTDQKAIVETTAGKIRGYIDDPVFSKDLKRFGWVLCRARHRPAGRLARFG